MRTPVCVGVVGLGAAGMDLARAFAESPRTDVRWLCDERRESLLRVRGRHPQARAGHRYEDLLEDEMLDAVALAVPLELRAPMARAAVGAGKHVLVTAPHARTAADADDLVGLAKRSRRRLLAAPDAVFHPAVARLRELVESGALGDVYYLFAESHDPDADDITWELGLWGASLALRLLADEPVEVRARRESYIDANRVEFVSAYLKFATGVTAELQLSSLGPRRVARLTIVGAKQVAVLEEAGTERILTLHTSAETATHARFGAADLPSLRCDAFASAVRGGGRTEYGSGRFGAAVVGLLEAMELSLEDDGLEAAPDDADAPSASVIALPLARAH